MCVFACISNENYKINIVIKKNYISTLRYNRIIRIIFTVKPPIKEEHVGITV